MVKKTLLLAILSVMAFFAHARKQYTVLYLIPFESDSYEQKFLKNQEDMEKVKSFGLMGFWNGSQMALDEYASKKDISLNVVVKDVSNSESKLRNILDDESLMREVDLIIGPFYKRMFMIASDYARKYGIPIVSPFTSRHEILEDNEYVFKSVVSESQKAAMISYLAEQSNALPVLVYGDSSANNREWSVCRRYFENNGVPYFASPNTATLLSRVQPGKKQIVLCFDDNSAKSLIISRSLIYNAKNPNLIFIIPESWLDSKTYDIEYYSQLNLHFFSNYYIDNNNEETKVFIYDYTHRFGVPPTLKSFAFQGYDITRFFLEYLINDKDIDRIKVNPIAFPLSFDKVQGGGYENVNLQFLEIVDNEIVPSSF